ncbi:hypothetical protein GHT06_011460 [Daphnia sinensis]|uniref:TAF6 C-terminal HEAT repeat domain-containing protein n=1 Tax=Daphnia sinensis TaxID=1820382 RepID=A0AAD5LEN2_9CRUS|nr:hypothetical protein GHT06_011460 [Daphnia sinensis]
MSDSSVDIDSEFNVESPLYVFSNPDHIPFLFASGGSYELHFHEDKELHIADIIGGSLSKLPLVVSLRAVPENPSSFSKDQQQLESSDLVSKLAKIWYKTQKKSTTLTSTNKPKTETVQVKQLIGHELSVEQQLYHTQVTEACEAFQSLDSYPGLHQMLSCICTFIAEGLRVNLHELVPAVTS